MNIHPAITLFKKDFRLNLVPIFGGAALIFLPYLVGLTAYLTTHHESVRQRIRDSFSFCPQMSIALTGAIAAVFGGAAFAYERRERWADFLAMMPTPRVYSILSKSALALVFLTPIWAFNIFAARWLAQLRPYGEDDVDLLIASAGPMLLLFGIAWLLSSFLSSPAIAACTSIGLCLASSLFYNVLCAYLYSGHPTYTNEINYDLIGCGLCAIVGAIGFICGSIYYVRRVEP